MRTVLITGSAGFIGSNLAGACLALGDQVIGVDSLTKTYDVDSKRRNLEALLWRPRFSFRQTDVATIDQVDLEGVDVVFHLAGQPGVRGSWGAGFSEYVDRNVVATQRLLEAAVAARTPRLVFASSSSVYGNSLTFPTTENDLPNPVSPYGVTKLAAERLCSAYSASHGLHAVSLRYFTVYGPRQRPDMAIHRLIESALSGSRFALFGGGRQIREFTFVDDVVRATLLAGEADVMPGFVGNVAGNSQYSLLEVVALIEDAMAIKIDLDISGEQPGDAQRTHASIDLAQRQLGWEPAVDLAEGLMAQIKWHKDRRIGLSTAPH